MPSPLRDLLQDVGLAICAEMLRLINERGRSPLRPNSPLAQQLSSGQAVQVQQQREAGGRFGSYGGASLTLLALDYLQWVDSGRRPGARKVPIAALVAFIKARNLRLRDRTSGRFVNQGKRLLKGRNGKPDLEVNRLAFMLQNAIYKNGIKGRHFIQPAFELGQGLVDAYLDEKMLDGLTLELEQHISYLDTKP